MNEHELDLLLNVEEILNDAGEKMELREGLVGGMVWLGNLRDRVEDGELSEGDRKSLAGIVNWHVNYVWALIEGLETK